MDIVAMIGSFLGTAFSWLLILGTWVSENLVLAILIVVALGVIFVAVRVVFNILRALIAVLVVVIALVFLYQYTPIGEWLGRDSAPERLEDLELPEQYVV